MGSTTINAETHNHTIHYNPLQQTHAVKCEQEEMTGWDIVSTLKSDDNKGGTAKRKVNAKARSN
jgi:hypothetical protein|tara:strand:+ start:241 stop:432 length:192 start_codon:yes stop_codon:yes gene_type:complete